MMRKAIYPGSFDPPTNGHVDLINRAAKLFDHLIVGVGRNRSKNPMFSPEERIEMIQAACSGLPNVSVEGFDGLLVRFAADNGASIVVRGLRALSDFENEFQMALANRALAPSLETVFLMTSADHMFVSSGIVREIGSLGGDVTGMVPPVVAKALEAKLKGG